MTLWWNETGPKVSYDYGVFQAESLNPSTKVAWRMSRWEMFRLGIACLFAVVKP